MNNSHYCLPFLLLHFLHYVVDGVVGAWREFPWTEARRSSAGSHSASRGESCPVRPCFCLLASLSWNCSSTSHPHSCLFHFSNFPMFSSFTAKFLPKPSTLSRMCSARPTSFHLWYSWHGLLEKLCARERESIFADDLNLAATNLTTFFLISRCLWEILAR